MVWVYLAYDTHKGKEGPRELLTKFVGKRKEGGGGWAFVTIRHPPFTSTITYMQYS